MAVPKELLRFYWWNVQSFAHFDESRVAEYRWPSTTAEYQAKCQRIDTVLKETFASSPPDILALAEITEKAALDLRNRIAPGHAVSSLDLLPRRSEFQIAILYDPVVGGSPDLLVVPEMPRSTRPMGVLDVAWPGHRLRVYACHWTARFDEKGSAERRSDIARFLGTQVYQFLHEDQQQEKRHVVIMGDLNEEPYGILESRLHTTRDRASSQRKHYSDADVKRARLYNCMWRHLGERRPFATKESGFDAAGTFFWAEKNEWHTYDHVIVSGTLLTAEPPLLDETVLEVVVHPLLFEVNGQPSVFRWNQGKPTGVSDHLPLQGVVRLTGEKTND